MRKIIVLAVLFLGILFVIIRFSEVANIVQTLQHANPLFLGVAFIIQAAWFFVLGGTFKSIYALLGLKESLTKLTLIAAAGSFVNIVTPSAGVGGLAIFISEGHAHGLPPGKITVASILYILMDYAAFLCVLPLGMIALLRHNHLGAADITAAIFLLAIAVVLAFLFYIGYRSTKALGEALAKIARLINHIVWPFIHREYLSEARAHSFASEISDGLGALPEKPRSLALPFLLSLVTKFLLMGILICSFLSFAVPFTPGTVLGGFAIGYLFLIVSPTPSGIGIVEGVMAIALGSLGVNFSNAVVITLAYRGMTFWLPLAIGAIAFRFLHTKIDKNAEAIAKVIR